MNKWMDEWMSDMDELVWTDGMLHSTTFTTPVVESTETDCQEENRDKLISLLNWCQQMKNAVIKI